MVLSPVYSHLKSRMNEVEKCRYYFVVLASIKDVGNITSIYNKYKNKIKGCIVFYSYIEMHPYNMIPYLHELNAFFRILPLEAFSSRYTPFPLCSLIL